MILLLALAACTSTEAPPVVSPPASPATPAPAAPTTPAAPYDPTPAPRADPATVPALGPDPVDLPAFGATWQPVLRGGVELGGVRFGGAFRGADGADATSLHPRGPRTFLLTHFERVVGEVYLSELARTEGAWRALSTSPVDLGPAGLFLPCAAAVTPWGTHLGSEEYEPDAAVARPDGTLPDGEDRGRGPESGYDEGWNARVAARPGSHPYQHGWVTEIAVGDDGATTLRRRLALGRFSHEQQLAMPDRRTVYLSDDVPHGGGLYRFVASREGDLTAGVLSAARWSGGRVDWVELGELREATLRPHFDEPPDFDDLFERTVAPKGGGCATGTLVVSSTGRECLAVKPDQEMIAAAFETRRLAGVKGATVLFTKEEGLAHDPATNTLYVALSRVTAVSAAALGLPENRCGVVVAVDLATGATSTVLAGRPGADKTCDLGAIGNPDNLTFAPELDTLFVAEDGGGKGGANWLWAWKAGALTPVARSLPGAEVSGLSWTVLPDGGWLTLAFQSDEGGSPVGLLGPFAR